MALKNLLVLLFAIFALVGCASADGVNLNVKYRYESAECRVNYIIGIIDARAMCASQNNLPAPDFSTYKAELQNDLNEEANANDTGAFEIALNATMADVRNILGILTNAMNTAKAMGKVTILQCVIGKIPSLNSTLNQCQQQALSDSRNDVLNYYNGIMDQQKQEEGILSTKEINVSGMESDIENESSVIERLSSAYDSGNVDEAYILRLRFSRYSANFWIGYEDAVTGYFKNIVENSTLSNKDESLAIIRMVRSNVTDLKTECQASDEFGDRLAYKELNDRCWFGVNTVHGEMKDFAKLLEENKSKSG